MKRAKKRKLRKSPRNIKKAKVINHVVIHEQARTVSDLEDLLVGSLVAENQKAKSAVIEDMLYNITPSISNLGYRHGYSVGKNLFSKANHKNVLPEVLEKMSFGKVTYVPLDDRLIITSSGTVNTPAHLGINLHTYEAGIISGYLSNATNSKIYTKEVQCRYNNSHFCQFVSSQQITIDSAPNPNTEKLIDSLSYAISAKSENEKEMNYRYSMLKLLPLLEEPLVGELAKLLHAAGAKLGSETQKENAEQILSNMALNFGLKGFSLQTKKKNKRVIKLKYGQYNSTDGFILLSMQPFVGFSTELFNSNASIYKSINQDKSYTITIELNRSKGQV